MAHIHSGSDHAGSDALRTGRVKWYDPQKGYGFILDEAGGADILLHANTLRDFGRPSIVEQAKVTFREQRTERGGQVSEIVAIEPPDEVGSTRALLCEGRDTETLDDLPWQPARVKWFDGVKGFGFANVFGHLEDVFIRADTLRRDGFADLKVGEAVSIRVSAGKRGFLAAQVGCWDNVEPQAGEVLTPSDFMELGHDEFRLRYGKDNRSQSRRR